MNQFDGIHVLLSSRCSAIDYEHVQQVSKLATTDAQHATALLHDFVEDAYGTWDEVEAILGGLAESCLPALRLLTRGPEPYEEYIQRIADSGNRLAMSVKALDLIDHLSPNRWHTLKPEKIDRYISAFRIITIAGQAISTLEPSNR
ncbi:hypothetical protein BH09CHL1_BH09CHL1_19520 [soil metagenome]